MPTLNSKGQSPQGMIDPHLSMEKETCSPGHVTRAPPSVQQGGPVWLGALHCPGQEFSTASAPGLDSAFHLSPRPPLLCFASHVLLTLRLGLGAEQFIHNAIFTHQEVGCYQQPFKTQISFLGGTEQLELR